ncbi:hypothetical protein ANAPRD1_01261 [Anaplasma phagocytophilum]|nr:hypothetical protein ANAPRD1_01261 [Anaplasma phagocytophilum]
MLDAEWELYVLHSSKVIEFSFVPIATTMLLAAMYFFALSMPCTCKPAAELYLSTIISSS